MSYRAAVTAGAKCALVAFTLLFPTDSWAQSTGVIEGMVTLKLPRPLRSANRYPGAAAATRTVQGVPAVVYVAGRVDGVPPRPSDTAVMAQHDTAFVPAAIVVDVGSTVRFPNDDPFFHNVFSYSAPARFDLGRYPRGEAKEVSFDEAGVVKVYCEVHDFMRSVIVVTENPFHATADEDGRFRIEGVPPGAYTLVFLHPDVEAVQREVTVEGGGTTRVDVELR